MTNEQIGYEPPTVRRVGTLAELTLGPSTNKYTAPSSDYHYPHGQSFNFS